MALRLGDIAPNFDADTTHGKINFHEYLGDSWGILFSHPADYTPVCTTVWYPIIDGADRSVAKTYGMIDPELNDSAGMPLTVRSVFIIAPDKKIKLVITYPASTGRNFDEVIRVIDSLQLAPKHGLATPQNWKPGQQCVVLPSVSDEDAVKKFGKFDAKFKYLRLVDAPDSSAKL